MKKLIFGKKINFISGEKWRNYLEQALDLYENYNTENFDVSIEILDNLETFEHDASNPKLFRRNKNSFQINFGNAIVRWKIIKGEPLKVYAYVENPFKKSIYANYRKKFNSMEFSNRVEVFEQVLHELVLIPTAHFFDDLAIVHAACVGHKEGCVLLTGTGGVGKSSAMLSVSRDNDIGFISDDITVIDRSGTVYANFAWPKIYGYNCIGNDFSELILKNRSLIDRFHYYYKMSRNPHKVRRKIRPNILFENYHPSSNKITTAFFLFRENCERIYLSDLSPEQWADASFCVINAEYQVLYKFFLWEEYNSSLLGYQPLITMKDLRDKWLSIYRKVFGVNTKKLSIPIIINHADYQKQIKSLIKDSLFR